MVKNFYTKLTLSLITIFAIHFSSFAQSPPNLTSDVAWDSDPNTSGNQSSATTIAKIENAFNNGRRQEEIQKGLPTNSLGNLVLPTDWVNYAIHGKALFLMNAERNCRGGIDYDGIGGNNAALGLSFEQVANNLNTVAQNHANWLVTNDLFQHTGASNSTPFSRIQAVYGLNTCSEFLSRAENIYFLGTTASTTTAILEKAVYNWIYNDSGSIWGHREASLLQNQDIQGIINNGFENNYGSSLSEGMIGLAIAGENNNGYNPYNFSGLDRTEVIVLMIMDPTSDATATSNNCDYSAAAVLPIELVQFGAKQEGKDVILRWKTAIERDNSHFIIERATNGKEFEPIARIEGYGNSKTERTYRYADNELPTGIHYYRLMQFDSDGKSSPSTIVAVRFFEQLDLTTYINSEGLQMTFNSQKKGEGVFEIADINGIILQKGDVEIESGLNRIQKNIDDLPKGLYFLTLELNGVRETKKFVWMD